ncbi:MAG: DUF6580 family putative transport protein [Opitutales bacterium]
MSTDPQTASDHHEALMRWLPLFVALAVLYRMLGAWIPELGNASPLIAVFFCGALLFKRSWWILPALGVLALTDLLAAWKQGYPMVGTWLPANYLCYALAIGLGIRLRNCQSRTLLIGGSLAGSGLFYLITNSMAWLGSPFYAQTLAGWVQALTTGIPGYPPTWMFFRNQLMADLLFTTVFVFALYPVRRSEPAGSPQQVEA